MRFHAERGNEGLFRFAPCVGVAVVIEFDVDQLRVTANRAIFDVTLRPACRDGWVFRSGTCSETAMKDER